MDMLADAIYSGLSTDPMDCLTHCTSVLAEVSGADACFFVELVDGGYLPVTSYGEERFALFPKALDNAAQENTAISFYGNDLPAEIDLSAVLCIPISDISAGLPYKDDKRKKADSYEKVTAFLYFQKNSCSQAFAESFISGCADSANLLAYCLRFYQTLRESSIDKLTGALNRKFLDAALEEWVFDATAKSGIFSVVMLDIDFFKGVNDNYGHLIGDDVLRAISSIIREHLDSDDVLGRYGGEEFTVLLSGADKKRAYEFAEHLRNAIHNARILGDKRDVTVSLGAASFPEHGDTAKALEERVDKSLYIAKQTGRNRSLVWHDDYADDTYERQQNRQDFFTGDYVADANKTLSLYKMLAFLRLEIKPSEKKERILKEVLSSSGASGVTYFRIENNETTDKLTACLADHNVFAYNEAVLKHVISKQAPVHIIDWDNEKAPVSSLFTDWQSIAVAPAVYQGDLKGVLYAGVSIKENILKISDMSYLQYAATIIASVAE